MFVLTADHLTPNNEEKKRKATGGDFMSLSEPFFKLVRRLDKQRVCSD